VGRFFEGYWRSLKPLEVEEPVDVWIHRPLAYLLARLLLPTSVSPNLVTMGSILLGLAAMTAMLSEFIGHMPVAGLCIFLSAVLDCADGQLARMRGTSSSLGRMLDGVADCVVSLAVVGSGSIVVLRARSATWWELSLTAAAIVFTAVTGSFHTASYDHYKNIYLRFTQPKYQEGEDLETALRRRAESAQKDPLWLRAAWTIYLFYLGSQLNYIRSFDPSTTAQLDNLPAYSPQLAAIYRNHNSSLMRHWRRWFGFGSLTFGFALATAVNWLGLYLILRGLLFNFWYWGYMRPNQRRASEATFAESGVQSAIPSAQTNVSAVT
jgi:phosphatidylglycerophosphate synthase